MATPSVDSPTPRLTHVSGLDAMPLVTDALARFEPAVLLTSGGLGAIFAPGGPESAAAPICWFLADSRALLDWESHRRHVITLSFQSPDERIYLTMSGRAEVLTDPLVASAAWRPSFKRWFPSGADDPRLLLVRFSIHDAEYFGAAVGRVAPHVRPH